jgi:poly-gamma-glutamate synthesis protein (capsule biosynthesis protein)
MLCGDVMLGRGIDQILPHPSPPVLYEDYVRSALDYVALAERANGPIPRSAPASYVWGDAVDELARRKPDLRIINLETAVTHAERPAPKGINYRMNPANLTCLAAARIDCCSLANNHVLDWGRDGLLETLDSLARSGIACAGAGRTEEEAKRPAALDIAGKGRVLVYAVALPSSGVPLEWSAGRERPGVHVIAEPSDEAADALASLISRERRAGDIVVLSIHWGDNWGYTVPPSQSSFARRLLASEQVDIIHGHSSHHFKAVEIFEHKPILYGCGDFLNDYEGIGGYEEYRSDLVLMYLLTMSLADASLVALDMVPFRIRNFRLNRADPIEARWVWRKMNEECRRFHGAVVLNSDDTLSHVSRRGAKSR